MTVDPHAQPKGPAFCEALNLLIQSQAHEDPHRPGKFIEPTNRQIADAINAKYGEGSITDEYIRKLRKGDIKNPGLDYASLIAGVFDLPLDVFNTANAANLRKVVSEVQHFLDTRRQKLGEEQESLPSPVRVLARTTRRLSPAGQDRVLRFANQLKELEAMESETRPHD
ncbi:hypothetical protein ABZ804_22370 [Streptomyces sp. NPDC047726]|uniref:hypothetical protein n=1 Tax=unclassified Streptomyces TaxID=2593676 RepID=UPI0033CD0163